MAIQRVIKPTNNARGIGDRGDFGNFFGRHDLGFQPHVAVLCTLGHQHIHAIAVIGQGHATHVVQAAGHAGDRL